MTGKICVSIIKESDLICSKCKSDEVYYENALTGCGKYACYDCGNEGEASEFVKQPIKDMDKVKVYKIDDYSWFASKWDIEKTNKHYSKYFDHNDLENVIECDIDKDGMWWETTAKEDIEKLGDNDETIKEIGHCEFGDLMRIDGDIYKFIPFRKAIELMGDFTEPYEVASTEW